MKFRLIDHSRGQKTLLVGISGVFVSILKPHENSGEMFRNKSFLDCSALGQYRVHGDAIFQLDSDAQGMERQLIR